MANKRKPKRLSDEIVRQAIEQVLEEPIPLPTIDGQICFRVQDDCDGDRNQQLIVTMLLNGDIAIRVAGPEKTLRFRNIIRGTASPHTHNALRLLMFAMWKDDELDKKRKTARMHP